MSRGVALPEFLLSYMQGQECTREAADTLDAAIARARRLEREYGLSVIIYQITLAQVSGWEEANVIQKDKGA